MALPHYGMKIYYFCPFCYKERQYEFDDNCQCMLSYPPDDLMKDVIKVNTIKRLEEIRILRKTYLRKQKLKNIINE